MRLQLNGGTLYRLPSVMSPPSEEPLFTGISDASALAEAVRQARASLSLFMSSFAMRSSAAAAYFVKVPFVASGPNNRRQTWTIASEYSSAHLHLWLRAHDALEDLLFAHVVEVPSKVSGLKTGDTFVIGPEQLEDWMIRIDGLAYGAFTLRLQRAALPEAARAEFDEHTGINQFADDPP